MIPTSDTIEAIMLLSACDVSESLAAGDTVAEAAAEALQRELDRLVGASWTWRSALPSWRSADRVRLRPPEE